MSIPEIQHGDPDGIGGIIRRINESHEVLEEQYLRVRAAADIAARSLREATQALSAARQALIVHQAAQAEHPKRRGSRPRHLLLALATIAIDGVACYFAAQALNGDQNSTDIWTALFLVVLAVGEFALDHFEERHRRLWQLTAGFLAVFVIALGALRYSYLATIDAGDPMAAVTGAALLTGVTIGLLFCGYQCLRTAETQRAWRARRAARRARNLARAAEETAARDARHREELADAYLWQIRRLVHLTPSFEASVRAHLTGRTEA